MNTSSKVAIIPCQDYDLDRVRVALVDLFSHFGGIKAFVDPGDKVLIKPNLIASMGAETAAITHPKLIHALAQLIKDAGAQPYIGDSPAFGSFQHVARVTGVAEVARLTGSVLLPLNQPRPRKALLGTGYILLSSKLSQVNKIINLPKLKVHCQMELSAGVKNMFGCAPGKIKVVHHFLTSCVERFSGKVINHYLATKPVFTVIDAITMMERDGPTGGDPKQWGYLVGGIDCFAIDRVICHMMDLDHQKVPLLRKGEALGLTDNQLSRIAVVPTSLDQCSFEPVLPAERQVSIHFSFKQIVRSLIRHVKIYIKSWIGNK